jgi:sulfur-oxidizing protein SoxX
LRARLVDPSKSNPNTIMPAYFKTEHLHRVAPQFTGKTVLSGQEIEDVVAYLLTIQRP